MTDLRAEIERLVALYEKRDHRSYDNRRAPLYCAGQRGAWKKSARELRKALRDSEPKRKNATTPKGSG